jgi:hypothetical protein
VIPPPAPVLTVTDVFIFHTPPTEAISTKDGAVAVFIVPPTLKNLIVVELTTLPDNINWMPPVYVAKEIVEALSLIKNTTVLVLEEAVDEKNPFIVIILPEGVFAGKLNCPTLAVVAAVVLPMFTDAVK